MSIAEKQATISKNNVIIAENVPKVYKAGQDSMVDESKIIAKAANGNPVYLDDVSEIPHDVGIQLSSDTITDFSDVNVTVCGKNLFGGEALRDKLVNAAQAVTDDAEKTVTYAAANVSGHVIFDAGFEEDTQYTVILYGVNTNTAYNYHNLQIVYTDGTTGMYQFQQLGTPSYSVTLTQAGKTVKHISGAWGGATTVLYYEKCGIFKGIVSTEEFEPYNGATYKANADGTVEGAKSLSPYMSVYSDADVDINVDYRKSYGMQTEMDRTYYRITGGGTRKNFSNAFAYGDWSGWIAKDTIKPTMGLYRMFYQMTGKYLPQNIDLSDIDDLSNVAETFAWSSKLLEVDMMNLPAPKGYSVIFRGCSSLQKITGFRVNKETTFDGDFYNNAKLTEIEIIGTLGTSIDFSYSPLSVECMKNIIRNNLADYSTENTGVYTITFKEDCWTALETSGTPCDDGLTEDETMTWETYVNEVLGWLT